VCCFSISTYYNLYLKIWKAVFYVLKNIWKYTTFIVKLQVTVLAHSPLLLSPMSIADPHSMVVTIVSCISSPLCHTCVCASACVSVCLSVVRPLQTRHLSLWQALVWPFTSHCVGHRCLIQILYFVPWQSLVSAAESLPQIMVVTVVHCRPFTWHHHGHECLLQTPNITVIYLGIPSIAAMFTVFIFLFSSWFSWVTNIWSWEPEGAWHQDILTDRQS
jgi:hypothetical protein